MWDFYLLTSQDVKTFQNPLKWWLQAITANKSVDISRELQAATS